MRNMVGLRWASSISSVVVLVELFTIPPVVLASSGNGVTCNFDEGTHTVTVTIDQVFFFGGLTNANGEIRLTAGSQQATDCGTSTMTNTDTVIINDVTPPPGPGGGLATASIDIVLDGGAWGPGFSDEPGASDEIEFVINLGAPGPAPGVEGDTVDFDGSASQVASTVVLGGDQANLNADEVDGLTPMLSWTGWRYSSSVVTVSTTRLMVAGEPGLRPLPTREGSSRAAEEATTRSQGGAVASRSLVIRGTTLS